MEVHSSRGSAAVVMRGGPGESTRGRHAMHDVSAPRDTATLDPQSAPPTSQRLTVSAEQEGGPSSVMIGGPGGPPAAGTGPAAGVTVVPQNVQIYRGPSCEMGELPEVPLKPPQVNASRTGGRSEERALADLGTPATGDEWWGPSEIEARRLRLVEHLNDVTPKTLPMGLMVLVPAQEHRDSSRTLPPDQTSPCTSLSNASRGPVVFSSTVSVLVAPIMASGASVA